MSKASNHWFTLSAVALATTILAAIYLIAREEFLKQSGIDAAQNHANWSWYNSAEFHREILQHWFWRGLALSLSLSLYGWIQQLLFRRHIKTARRSLLVGAVSGLLSSALLAAVLYMFSVSMR